MRHQKRSALARRRPVGASKTHSRFQNAVVNCSWGRQNLCRENAEIRIVRFTCILVRSGHTKMSIFPGLTMGQKTNKKFKTMRFEHFDCCSTAKAGVVFACQL